MFLITRLLILFTISSITTIYANSTKINLKNDSPILLYQSIQKKLYAKNYEQAIQGLIKLQKLYLPDLYAQQIHLDLIYAYYKSNNLKESSNSIQKFLELYPNHKNLDYILYMNGIVYMALDTNTNVTILTNFFHINKFNYNPNYANIAFFNLKQVIDKYPNSQYSLDAYKRLIFLKNRIAEYELSVVKFYFKKKAYISVINRVTKMIYCFPDTNATRKSLQYMKHAYQQINLIDQSNKILQIMQLNPKD